MLERQQAKLRGERRVFAAYALVLLPRGLQALADLQMPLALCQPFDRRERAPVVQFAQRVELLVGECVLLRLHGYESADLGALLRRRTCLRYQSGAFGAESFQFAFARNVERR